MTTGLALAVLIVVASGVALTRAGSPYSSVLLNVHKLVDLASVLAIGWVTFRAVRETVISNAEWAVVVVVAALTVGLFASGGVLSAMASPPRWVLWFHRLVPLAALPLAALGLFMML